LNEAPLGLLFSVLAALILFSGFFSGSETGMMSLNRYRLKYLKNNNHHGAVRASKLLDRPDRLIGLILIGNNLVNILAAAISTIIAMRLYGDAGIVIASLALTLVILIFSEITPKTIAALHPEKVAFPASLILLPMLRVLHPLVWLINQITNRMLKLLGIDPSKRSDDNLSSDELRSIVVDAGQHIPQRHQGMLLNILDLEQVTVDDIMIPRNEVFGIDLSDDDETILRRLQSSEYTRIPVYQEDINAIEGVLHLRNVGRVITQNGLDRKIIEEQMDQPYFVPEGTPLHTQLLNFQKQKRRTAMVVDEYGEIMGLVTLEDILEEIVGEFTSNLADNIDDIYPQTDGTFIVNGSATIREINRSLGWQLPTDGPKTLNGLMLEFLESFPDANTSIRTGDYVLEILELKDNFIKSVRAKQTEEKSGIIH
jgi:Mg2+/Co2+ transporter CorB